MPTSTATIEREAGFSLIEILVVVGLMAMITGVFVPSITSTFRVKSESVARRIALILGQARDRAMLTNKLIRFKVDFETQTLTLEEASSEYLVPKTSERPLSEREREEQEKKEADVYRPIPDLMKEPMKMPEGLKVIEVRSARYKKPVTEGVASIYLFNNGSTDGATIFFESEEKVHQAIFLHPVTGTSRVEGKGPAEVK